MQKLNFTGSCPALGARRQRPAIVGTSRAGVKVIAASQHRLQRRRAGRTPSRRVDFISLGAQLIEQAAALQQQVQVDHSDGRSRGAQVFFNVFKPRLANAADDIGRAPCPASKALRQASTSFSSGSFAIRSTLPLSTLAARSTSRGKPLSMVVSEASTQVRSVAGGMVFECLQHIAHARDLDLLDTHSVFLGQVHAARRPDPSASTSWPDETPPAAETRPR